MRKYILSTILIVSLILLNGCVERKLTINTQPQGALIVLNDEEIGTAPVTVSFNWYGDYDIRISKEGYETLKTHRMLEGPWYDKFPFDFFAQVLYSKKIVNSYDWSFELTEKKQYNNKELIQKAQILKKQIK